MDKPIHIVLSYSLDGNVGLLNFKPVLTNYLYKSTFIGI